jgi:hypothetical protein
MSLQTVMNLNRMVMLISSIQTDEGVQSRPPSECKSTALTSFQELSEWRKHDNCEQQLIESQFNFECVCDHVKKFPRYQNY